MVAKKRVGMMISVFTVSRLFTVHCADHGIQRGFNGSITMRSNTGRAGIAIMSLQLGKAEMSSLQDAGRSGIGLTCSWSWGSGLGGTGNKYDRI